MGQQQAAADEYDSDYDKNERAETMNNERPETMMLVSCDTFAAMGDVTDTGEVIFGKNSDRPKGEVQELVLHPAQKHQQPCKLKVKLSVCYQA